MSIFSTSIGGIEMGGSERETEMGARPERRKENPPIWNFLSGLLCALCGEYLSWSERCLSLLS